MNKSRIFLSALALLLLIGISLWLWPRSESAVTTSVSVAQTIPVPGDQKPSPSSSAANTAKTAAPGAVAFPNRTIHTESSDSLAIGNLLADSSLDNKAVMAALSKMTLDADRPIEERTEAMGHLLNLSVEEPSAVLLPLIGDAHLPDSLCEKILDDSLNDSLAWQADASLAALSHRSSKELKDKAREHLGFLTGADHGNDLAGWSQAIADSKEKWSRLQP
ncbi:MAG TPA: hypothetical protein VL357_11625 [Rariglobus sp.]|jgi:hypothetical protein|nr:hypothetical protein [Rariglobus sp.]